MLEIFYVQMVKKFSGYNGFGGVYYLLENEALFNYG